MLAARPAVAGVGARDGGTGVVGDWVDAAGVPSLNAAPVAQRCRWTPTLDMGASELKALEHARQRSRAHAEELNT